MAEALVMTHPGKTHPRVRPFLASQQGLNTWNVTCSKTVRGKVVGRFFLTTLKIDPRNFYIGEKLTPISRDEARKWWAAKQLSVIEFDKVSCHEHFVPIPTCESPQPAPKPKPEPYRLPVKNLIWTPEMQALVPASSYAKTYIPQRLGDLPDTEILSRAFLTDKFVIIEGPAGCGKNHCVMSFCAEKGLPLHPPANLNGSSSVEDLIGQWILKDHSTVWVDGILTKAMRDGGVVQLDEVNAASPEVLFVLHEVLDDRRHLVLLQKGAELIKMNPGFWLVCTMNSGYAGTRELNEAFKDRFTWLTFGYNKEAERMIIGSEVNFEKLVSILREMFKKGELAEPCSTRLIKEFISNLQVFGKKTAKMIFVSRFSDDTDAVEDAFKLHMGY